MIVDVDQLKKESTQSARLKAEIERGNCWHYLGEGSEHPSLCHQATGYEVPLSDMTDCPNVLDWIAQIASKGWACSVVIGDFVIMLDVLLDLQGNYCGSGIEHAPGWPPKHD